jgi:PHD/YefM family antitoxin component YafN of YafNO toxin-antitoxin module
MVTKRGVDAAVLVPVSQWRRMNDQTRPTLKELLLAPEGRGDLDVFERASRPRRDPLTL